MPPKQSTLGKFFGKQDGSVSKAPPRQATLSFGTKSAPKIKLDESNVDEEDIGMKDEDIDEKEAVQAEIKSEDNKEDIVVDEENLPTTKSLGT